VTVIFLPSYVHFYDSQRSLQCPHVWEKVRVWVRANVRARVRVMVSPNCSSFQPFVCGDSEANIYPYTVNSSHGQLVTDGRKS